MPQTRRPVRAIPFLAALASTSCGDAASSGGLPGPTAEAWTLAPTPTLQIGVVEGEEPYQLHEVTSATRLDDGRIVVANNSTKQIRFFGPDGGYLAAVGQQGEGPGEYRILDRVRMGGPDSLLVFDTYQARISVLDPGTGAYRSAVPMPDGEAFPFDEWLHGRTIVDSPLEPGQRGIVAAALDSLPVFDGAQHRYVRVTREGHLWVAARKVPLPGESVAWRIHDLSGRLVATLTTPPGFAVHDIGPDWVLGEWRDELDVEFVRLYALQRPTPPRTDGLHAAVRAWSGPPPAFGRIRGDEAGAARTTLMQMAMSEEMFYAQNFHYTLSVDSLVHANPRFQLPSTVELLPLWVEDNGWMFMAADADAGATCFISYGFVRLMGRQPGEIACWRT
ncbi:MAG TPA: 6-bladed beta-propeller [Longimicrobiales bacterium]|nr:6-bladed beta-propeller [Longimicrobiales bacterium]